MDNLTKIGSVGLLAAVGIVVYELFLKPQTNSTGNGSGISFSGTTTNNGSTTNNSSTGSSGSTGSNSTLNTNTLVTAVQSANNGTAYSSGLNGYSTANIDNNNLSPIVINNSNTSNTNPILVNTDLSNAQHDNGTTISTSAIVAAAPGSVIGYTRSGSAPSQVAPTYSANTTGFVNAGEYISKSGAPEYIANAAQYASQKQFLQ